MVIDFELHKTDHTIRFYIITTVMFNKNKKAFFVSLKESHKWFYVFCKKQIGFHCPLFFTTLHSAGRFSYPRNCFWSKLSRKICIETTNNNRNLLFSDGKSFTFFSSPSINHVTGVSVKVSRKRHWGGWRSKIFQIHKESF